jgi:3D (Asp-Asp-Asp) domain-containing protein
MASRRWGKPLAAACLAVVVAPGAGAAARCQERRMRVTFYTCARGDWACLTKLGRRAVPLRTVAVGDRRLLGRWLYVASLGGLVEATDTGPALEGNSIDVFVGEARLGRWARRLGVRHWPVQECRVLPEAGVGARRFMLLGLSGGQAVLARRAERLLGSRDSPSVPDTGP